MLQLAAEALRRAACWPRLRCGRLSAAREQAAPARRHRHHAPAIMLRCRLSLRFFGGGCELPVYNREG
jgi:hypothetical protein